jgi:hypothetical protein
VLTFIFHLTVGFYLGTLVGLAFAAVIAAAFWRERDAAPAGTAPRLIELMHADATNYGRN